MQASLSIFIASHGSAAQFLSARHAPLQIRLKCCILYTYIGKYLFMHTHTYTECLSERWWCACENEMEQTPARERLIKRVAAVQYYMHQRLKP